MRAVLFDLDGTLLDLDLDAFLVRYFAALERAAAPLAQAVGSSGSFMYAIGEATRAMMKRHPGRTNQTVFDEEMLRRTGVDMREQWPTFESFYSDVFPGLADTAGPAPGAQQAFSQARALGLRVAIATNPIFPRVAVDHRLAWAGLDGADADVVTTYEQMESCKPYPEYFLQTASLLRVAPQDCLMVGDDPMLDLPARAVGMRTYYVGSRSDVVADYRGDLHGLTALLPDLV